MERMKVFRLTEEIEPRFTGWMKKENQGLKVGWRTRTKVYRLYEELGLQVGRRKKTKVYKLGEKR